jgi:hypothetical protein
VFLVITVKLLFLIISTIATYLHKAKNPPPFLIISTIAAYLHEEKNPPFLKLRLDIYYKI